MTTVDDLWFLADEAGRRAERAYHRLRDRYDGFLERRRTRRLPRERFRTVARRVKATGAPYGAHTLVYRGDADSVLLVRHEEADLWVPPGGEVRSGERYHEAAERELAEEAGVAAAYEGLALVTRVEFACDEYRTWGVLPVFAAEAETHEPSVADPDGEISAARWFPFDDLPADTRDRDDLLAWRERRG